MSKPVILTWLVILALVAGLVLPAAFHVLAAPPSNDDFNTPHVIQEFPFLHRMDISEATYATDDPQPSCFPPESGAHPESTVWFSFIPAEDVQIRADTYGSDYFMVLSIYRGERGALVEEVCSFSSVSFTAQANTRYSIMVGALPYDGVYPAPPGSPWRSLVFSVSLDPPPPPPNDHFDAALGISSVPFSQLFDNTAASMESGEPVPSCINGHTGAGRTVWYTYSPAEDRSFRSRIENPFWVFQAWYTGNSLDNLNEIGCALGSLSLPLTAGQTYYIQVGTLYDLGGILLYTFEQIVPPPNDDFDTARVIPTLPYADTLDTENGSSAPDDPADCSNNGSVWYTFTPASDVIIEANTFGSDYDTVLSVYTGERGALVQVPGMCVDDTSGLQSQVMFQAYAGTTYYFMIGSCCGNGGEGGGDLVFHVFELVPPANDLFSNALEISEIPFSDTQNNALADVEIGEPFPSCRQWYAPNRTIWYRITPRESRSVVISYWGFYSDFLGVYTGTSLDSLVEVGCSGENTSIILQLEAGQTYAFQLGSQYMENGSLTFNIDYAPLPSADFTFSPSNPSIYNLVTFTNLSNPSSDSCTWDFGDGDSGRGCTVTHQYQADGEYPVTQTVSAPGGEPLSTTQVVPVLTHDLVIVRLKTPKSASARQTVSIRVGVRNLFYPEMAQVTLYKSSPGGFVEVDSLMQEIPSQPGNRLATLVFRYTLTEEDARIGKITFKATAGYLWADEALPCDNELISLPVKVER